jgi:16S rRNA (guanine966-N2)-methyltransferase
MRIIAGQRRGHKIDGPRGRDTRPTSDLVRESMFNILRRVVADRPVIDLFAGTGALGLEALSRGASHALFVERDRENAGLIRRNLATLRYEDRGAVVAADAYRWAKTFAPPPGEPVVVFLDPPYRAIEEQAGKFRTLLADLVAKLPDDSVLVVESGRPFDADVEVLPDLDAWDVRRYGGTYVAVRMLGDEAGLDHEAEAEGETDADGDEGSPDGPRDDA